MSTLYHGVKNNGTEVCIFHDKSARLPYIVGYRLSDTGMYRTLLAAENLKDVYGYYNELLA